MAVESQQTKSQGLDHATYKLLYELMVRSRTFEERLKVEYATGKVPGFVHLYCGEEAIAAGVGAHLNQDDYITSTHRGHGHCISKRVDVRPMVAEILGRATGLCKGKGGSMHIADIGKGMLGANGIVGGGLGMACGAALSAKLRNTNQVTVTFFGDGATVQGIFHEAINLAAIWNLPIIFVCENNEYAEASPFGYYSAAKKVSDRARGYNIPGVTVDGMDVLAVFEAAGEAFERARKGNGPTLIEAKAYRYYGHAQGDAQGYKPAGEEQKFRARDPITTYKHRVLENHWLTEQEMAQINAGIVAEIDDAWTLGYQSPMPEPADTYTDVYASY